MEKKDKYTLGGRMENASLDMLEFLIGASRSTDSEKVHYLEKAAIRLDIIKIFVRLSEESKALPTKKYLILQEMLQEIGKMLGGWLKATKTLA